MISLYNEYNETGDYQAFISAKECGNNKDNFLKVLKEELMDDNIELAGEVEEGYRDWETDRKSTRLNSSHSAKSRMPSSA